MATTNANLLSKAELDKLIQDAEQVVGQVLKAETEKLSKAKEEGSPAPEASPEASPEGSPGAVAPEGSPDGALPQESAAPAAPPEAAPAPAEGAPMDGAPPQDGAPAADPAADAGGQVDPAALKAEYSKLDDSALEQHYMACKGAMYERVQQAQGAQQPPQGAPPPAAAPSPSPAGPPASPSAPAFKSEKEVGQKLAKSEDRIAQLEKKITEQDEKMKTAVRAIELLTTPMRKSMTGLDFQPKPGATETKTVEKMSKSEIKAILETKVTDPKLSKKDRDSINGWYFGAVETKQIEHLLSAK